MFDNWSIGKKIGMGFGVVLSLLAVVAAWSVTGIGTIVGNASEVIDGNALRGLMVEKEVDHLKWAAKVGELINDDSITSMASSVITFSATMCSALASKPLTSAKAGVVSAA